MPASTTRFAKIVVTFERRDDGGLRAYSKDVPGFVLSNSDPFAVLSDIAPALEEILSSMWGVKVKAGPLIDPGQGNDDKCDLPEIAPKEYAACAAA